MPEPINPLDVLFHSITDIETLDKMALEIWRKLKAARNLNTPDNQELIKQYHALRKKRREVFNNMLNEESKLNMVFVN